MNSAASARVKTQSISWLGSFRFRGTDSAGGVIDTDGRGGDGVRPAEMLPISLAACTAYDIVNILRKQRQDLRSLEATIESLQDPDPPWRFRRITVRYVAVGDVDPAKAQKALDLSERKYCSVSETLRDVVALEFEIRVEASPLSASE